MTTMRAKLQVCGVEKAGDGEWLTFRAVCPPQFDKEGLSEDSTFSRYTPAADLRMLINNPALVGKFQVNDTFYVDFTPAG